MVSDLLTLTSVTITRETLTPDGMGATTTATSTTTLSKAAIWQVGSVNRYMSDKMTKVATNVLACLPSAYTWTADDRHASYQGNIYKIVGKPDDIMFRGELLLVPLEIQE